jgi:D-amino-acid dehydrogenase
MIKSPKVYMIGCGAVNLVTAYTLVKHGWQVEMIDKGPNPIWGQPHPGATWSGKDARMFTLTEADNYNDRTPVPSPLKTLFNRQLDKLGWDVRANREAEREWIQTHSSLPYQKAIECENAIQKFNIESEPLWNAMIRQNPTLFENAVLKEGIIRIYSDRNQYSKQLERHRSLNSLIETFNPLEKILHEMPGLAQPVRNNTIAGAFKTKGFTVNAHKFFKNMMRYLEDHGVEFYWGEEVHSVERCEDGRITALETEKRTITNGHFVLSPGAYGNKLLHNTSSRNLIGGVLGGWATIPHLDEGFSYSMKIARKDHITEDSNVTIATQNGQKVLYVGSGYGFTGFDPDNICPEQLQLVYRGIEDTIQKFFPNEYAQVKDTPDFRESFTTCVRPWTSNGLGIFEQIQTTSGGMLVISGGHNTGGFTQAPSVGQAVLAALEGKEHSMHHLYHQKKHRLEKRTKVKSFS